MHQHTVVHHLGRDISLLDVATNFDDDLLNFSKLIELGNYYRQFYLQLTLVLVVFISVICSAQSVYLYIIL